MPKLQSAITFQREKYRFQLLDMQIRQDLPPEDERVLSWIHCSKGANGFIACIPTQGRWLRNEEHTSMYARYMGLPQPACLPFVGKKIKPGDTATMDAFGNKICSMTLKGGGWTQRHDNVKWTLQKQLAQAGVEHTCEVYNLMRRHIPQKAQDVLMKQKRRDRQGIVPDFSISGLDGKKYLGDVKTMIRGVAYLENKHRNVAFGPINERAKRVNKEYQKHAKDLDSKYNGTMDGIVGPVQRAVQSFGRTQGFVVGAYGECSRDLLDLVEQTATKQSMHDWRRMGCKNAVEATGILVETNRTNISLAALRSHARLLLDRIDLYMNAGGTAALQRRNAARAKWEDLRWSEYLKNGPIAYVTGRPPRDHT